jgi:hypothetical protein
LTTYRTLEEEMAVYDVERLAKIKTDLAIHNLPENVAAREAKADKEFQLGVNMRWWDKDGNSTMEKDIECSECGEFEKDCECEETRE